MFGDYELLGTVGHGGMGVVYRARHVRHTRTVALKRLPPELSRDAIFATRFRQECRIATQLEHEHIVPIYDYGETDGQLFISMRLIDGPDLGALIKDGPLRPAEAVTIVSQIASALDYAHANRVEHRDVKPTNIMVKLAPSDASPPFAYLVDFGIARSEDMTALTQGGVVGSVPYMAPERVLGDAESGARSDVYSLACVLFEAVTGGVPFPRQDNHAVLFAHVNAPIPKASAVIPAVPAALDAVLERGMAKEPGDRYPSAGHMAESARRALTDAAIRSVGSSSPASTVPKPTVALPRPDPPASSGKRRVRIAAASLLAAVIVVGVVAAWLINGGSGQGGQHASTPAAQARSPANLSSQPTGRPSASTDASGSQRTPISRGTCLDSESAFVSCDAQHSFEVFATTAPCTSMAMLQYLGGHPGTDTLLPIVSAKSIRVDGRTVCAVQAPSGASATGMAKDVLVGSRGDSWRRCIGTDTRQTLPCDRSHVGEYVYTTASRSAQSVDCTEKASSYMQTAFVDFAGDLRVDKPTRGNLVACVVVLTSDNVLTASIKDLGTDALPTATK